MSSPRTFARFVAVLDALEGLGLLAPDATFDELEAAVARCDAELARAEDGGRTSTACHAAGAAS
jgi:hypothetical protein